MSDISPGLGRGGDQAALTPAEIAKSGPAAPHAGQDERFADADLLRFVPERMARFWAPDVEPCGALFVRRAIGTRQMTAAPAIKDGGEGLVLRGCKEPYLRKWNGSRAPGETPWAPRAARDINEKDYAYRCSERGRGSRLLTPKRQG